MVPAAHGGRRQAHLGCALPERISLMRLDLLVSSSGSVDEKDKDAEVALSIATTCK